jgi:hypothetical protein
MPGLRADTNYGVMDGFNGGTQETQGEHMSYSTCGMFLFL